ncbi:Mu homology domain containing protein [Lactarius tabidus]
MHEQHVVIFCISLSLSCVPFPKIVDQLYALTFIRTSLNIFMEYFGEVTAPVLRDNFDIVHQLLEETLDATKYSLSLASLDALDRQREISEHFPARSYGPWHKAGLPYNGNDINFDIVEKLDAVVNKNHYHEQRSRQDRCNLQALRCGFPVVRPTSSATYTPAGTPYLLLTLTDSHTITDPSFHPCVRLNCFAQSRALSIPPDGRFTLIEYRLDPSAKKPGAAPALTTTATVAQVQVRVPFTLRARLSISINDNGGAFELTFTPRAGALEDADVHPRVTHVTLVPSLFGLYDLRRYSFLLGTGPLREAPGHLCKQRCAPAPRAGSADLFRAACGHAASCVEDRSA